MKLIMTPGPGERLVRFVGDCLKFSLRTEDGSPLPEGWQVFLRTNLGRGKMLRHEIINSYPAKPPLAGAAWHDIPLKNEGAGWCCELALVETGFYSAKPYAVDPSGRQFWPDGGNVGVSIHPDAYRTGNTIYCAFVRMFGPSKTAVTTANPDQDRILADLDAKNYNVIPPSGKLRDLVRELPHVIQTLGCRIVHLLPVTPTPTTFARFGRFGSPYAVQDLTAIDPALVEFDKRTTGIEQFCELTRAAHVQGGRVFLDIPINHTGWGSTLQELHPEWYLKDENGNFISPGAWGVTWEDLVELNHRFPELWQNLAEVFLTWCRRGVDGFRCDAGYKVPMEVWRYITARVLTEFPDTIFLLEGLGGSWDATESLLCEGGMQWAYSELFQNYSGAQVAWYLDYSLRQSSRVGVYVHYSETHDNDRLAAGGTAWSLLRNRLCALTSCSGGYGFTSGVEWLAPEKVNVHSSRGLAWGRQPNIIAELSRLNRLLASHPAFYDGAVLTRLSANDSAIYALKRQSAICSAIVLVLVNTDAKSVGRIQIERSRLGGQVFQQSVEDLLGQRVEFKVAGDKVEFALPPASAFCLELDHGSSGAEGYAAARARVAWALGLISRGIVPEQIGPFDWRDLSSLVDASPAQFVGVLPILAVDEVGVSLTGAIRKAMGTDRYPSVVTWKRGNRFRITVVPRDHWFLIQDEVAFRVTLKHPDGRVENAASVPAGKGHVVAFAPMAAIGKASFVMDRFDGEPVRVHALLTVAGPKTEVTRRMELFHRASRAALTDERVLLTNGRGGMSRMCLDLGRITSKYDCLLGANLHPEVPVDRHVFVKRVRAWMLADGFITPLCLDTMVGFDAGPPAVWRFVANAGDGRGVECLLSVEMVPGRNITILQFHRPAGAPPIGRELPENCRVSLTVRFDIEDRNFHMETHRNEGADHHFNSHCLPDGSRGFVFAPVEERRLHIYCDSGTYHQQPEWCEHIGHPVEGTRGMPDQGDAFSPGWFEISLTPGQSVPVVVSAESEAEARESLAITPVAPWVPGAMNIPFKSALEKAVRAFVVKRGTGRTVIAGYPWFLDWGRDTLIAARGMLAAGMMDDVRQLLCTFGRFEEQGTLPNSIHGENASNRDTSDASLWYGVVCEEFAAIEAATCARSKGGSKADIYSTPVAPGGRTIQDVLISIATNHIKGTPNGIRMDPDSALIWSPTHFTWMDTNYPAGTPREGYPVEIQALWIRLLRQLEHLKQPGPEPGWKALADKAMASMMSLFWLEEKGWLADVLVASKGQSARQAVAQDALRSNCLLPVAFGQVGAAQARRLVANAVTYLVVPGALRSLAPLPVHPPLEIRGSQGGLLNNPVEPYWGHYEGDEDTRRKPAYHNGTAWCWTLPSLCEALARAWDFQPAAVEAARSYLESMAPLMNRECLGHLPEVMDGNSPHTSRGCDAQAWSVTEALRVLNLLEGSNMASSL